MPRMHEVSFIAISTSLSLTNCTAWIHAFSKALWITYSPSNWCARWLLAISVSSNTHQVGTVIKESQWAWNFRTDCRLGVTCIIESPGHSFPFRNKFQATYKISNNVNVNQYSQMGVWKKGREWKGWFALQSTVVKLWVLAITADNPVCKFTQNKGHIAIWWCRLPHRWDNL